MEDYWSAIAGAYEALQALTHWEERRETVLAGLAGRVLDIGCGSGAFVAEALSNGIDAWGLDRTRCMVNVARQRLAKLGFNPHRIILADAKQLPLPDRSFDTVLCTGVLGLMGPVMADAVVQEMGRVADHELRFLEPFAFGRENLLVHLTAFLADGVRLIPISILENSNFIPRAYQKGLYGCMSFMVAQRRIQGSLPDSPLAATGQISA